MSSHFPVTSQPFIPPLAPQPGVHPLGAPSLFTPGTVPHGMPGLQLGGDLADPSLTASTMDVHVGDTPLGFPPHDGGSPVPEQRGTKRGLDSDRDKPVVETSLAKGPRLSFAGNSARASEKPLNADAELRWALMESLNATRVLPGATRPQTEALCDAMARPRWDTPLNGKAISRKDADGNAQDLRHVVAYETMQSAAVAVLRISPSDKQNYATLERLAVAMGEVPTGMGDHARALSTAGKLNNFLFVCKGNFFLGDAVENQRAGSTTAALHHTEDQRVRAVNAATDVPGLVGVLGQATGSLSGPILDHTLEAYGLPELGPRPQGKDAKEQKDLDKTYDAAKVLAQKNLATRILESLPMLAVYRAESEPVIQGQCLTLLKSDVADVIEGLADSTAYDASRTGHTGLSEKQKTLNAAFSLFRAAERTGEPDSLVKAVQIMKAIDTEARSMAPEVLARKNGTATKPSFGPLYKPD